MPEEATVEERVLDTADSQVPSKKNGRRKKVTPASRPPVPPAATEEEVASSSPAGEATVPVLGAASGEEEKPKPARRRKEKLVPPKSEAGTEEFIPLEEIDLSDESFRFRANLRVGDLAESIAREGQQLPILLRRVPGKDKYQLISGFRRVTALQKLGEKDVKAIVRSDLQDDDKAFRVSILENEERKTYNDLDRANAIYQYKTRLDKSNAEIENIFRIGSRQRQRLESITTFPDVLKTALAEGKISSTLAVRLMQHARQHVQKTIDEDSAWTDETIAWVEEWLKWIQDDAASLEKLNAALREEVAEQREENPIQFCVEQERNGKKSLRIRPISIDESLTEDQRKKLIADLKATIEFVEGME